MQPHGHSHGVERQAGAHDAFNGQDRAVRRAPDEVQQGEGIGPIRAAADGHPVQNQRSAIDAFAHQALDALQLAAVAQHEQGLDALGRQTLQVLFDKGGARGYPHLLIGRLIGRLLQGRARDIVGGHPFGDVHLVGVDGDRHLIRRRRQIRQKVARVVGQPLGRFALALRRKGDRAADLQDHLGNRRAKALQHFVEQRQSLGARTVRFAAMDMQHSGAGIVAVDRLLDLRRHADRNVVAVAWQEFGPIGRSGDDQGLLGFGKQRVVEEVHGRLLKNEGVQRPRSAISSASMGKPKAQEWMPSTETASSTAITSSGVAPASSAPLM